MNQSRKSNKSYFRLAPCLSKCGQKSRKDGQVIRNNGKMTTKAIINRQFA